MATDHILSGRNMAVDGADGCFEFRIHKKHYPVTQVGGNQKAGMMRKECNIDWGGYYRANGYTPATLPNDDFTFKCAPEQTGDIGVSGTALCLAVEIVVDTRNPKQPLPIYHTVFFAANGTDLSLDQTAPTDTSTPTIYPPKGLCAYFGSSQTGTKYQSLRIFSRGSSEAVDCTTDGVFARDKGEIDAEFRWIRNIKDSGGFPTPADGQKVARMYVTSALYWALTWMQIEDCPDPWAHSRMGPNSPVDGAFRATFSGHSGTTDGSIVMPDSTEFWPTDGR